jgi:L-ascorbate metabolism protein UlaG (beta-lactamase superfamily)
MKITWLGQGGYLIEHAEKRLVIDPYLTDSVAKVDGFHRLVPPPVSIENLVPDILFITHDHLDHFDPDTLQPLILLSKALLLGPQSVINHGRQLGFDEKRLVLVCIGESKCLSGFTFTPTPAKHSDKNAVGILVETENRLVYFSGDTLYTPDFGARVRELIRRPLNAAFVCMNGRLGNMNAEEAAEFLVQLQPDVAVPMHFGMFAENTADPRDFESACHAKGQNTFIMKTGGTIEI